MLVKDEQWGVGNYSVSYRKNGKNDVVVVDDKDELVLSLLKRGRHLEDEIFNFQLHVGEQAD